MEALVSCENLVKKYEVKYAVNDLSLIIKKGEITSLVGPSGCGKTTALRLIAGFIRPESGTIKIAGKKVSNGKIMVPPEKRNVGIIFQDYALFPHLTVRENICYGIKGKNKKEIADKYIGILGLLGLENRKPNELSGGQQQRVAIARALAPNPDVLLMDEPFSNLDKNLRLEVRKEIKEILKSNGISVLFVTHDNEEAFFMGDEVAIMNEGKILQYGSPEYLFNSPNTKFIANLIGNAQFLKVERTAGKAETTLGVLDLPEQIVNYDNLEIMIRSDDLEINDYETGPDTVLSSQFLGEYSNYKILLESGEIVETLQHHTVDLEDGSKVRVGICSHHNPPFFSDGNLVYSENTENKIV